MFNIPPVSDLWTPLFPSLTAPTGTVEIIAPVISVVALVAICIAVVLVAVFRKKSRCMCSCSDLETVIDKPVMTDCDEIGKSFSISKVTKDCIRPEVTVCVSSERPDSVVEDVGDFVLEDETPFDDQDDGRPTRNSPSLDI